MTNFQFVKKLMSNIVKRKLACDDVLKYNDVEYSLKEIQRLFLLMNKLD